MNDTTSFTQLVADSNKEPVERTMLIAGLLGREPASSHPSVNS